MNDNDEIDLKHKMALKFAKELARQVIYDPAKSTARSSVNYSVYTKENIISWLQSPITNEKKLRNASNYLYIVSMHYQRLMEYYAGLPMWYYVISPLGFDVNKAKPDAFRKQYLKVAHLLELMNIQDEMKKMCVVALREGAFYGVRWLDSSSSFVQKLNADYCTITHLSDGVFLFKYDVSSIKEEKLECYPPEFTTMYNAYKAGGSKYQEVPSEIAVCLKADSSIVDYTVPLFSSVMPSLYTIANVESLQETADELRNYKMITGEIPVDDDGNPKMEWDLALQYYKHLTNAVGDNVGVAVTPFKLDSFDFEQKTGVADVDTISRAIQNYWSTVGSSALLHGISNDTAGVTKLSIKNDEMIAFSLMKQCERIINRYLKTQMGGSYKFKITFLPITVYNHDEMVQKYKEAITYGVGKSYYMSSIGISQSDIEGLDYIEDNVLKIDEILTPMLSSNTMSTDSKARGRPSSDDEDLDESGESTRGNDTNANR